MNNHIDDVQKAYLEAYKSVINFRKLFMPAPKECIPPDFHNVWNEILLHGKKHVAIEAFRESGKSQIVIRGHTLYRLVFPSEDYNYIVLILANQRTASKKLKEIADEYLSDPSLSANLIKVREQSEKALDVEVMDIFGKHHQVRIEAYGKGASIRGLSYKDRRPKLIVMDDCQDTESAQSETVCEKDYEWFLSDVKFLGQDCRIFMIANNLGERCLIEQVISNAEHLGFEYFRIPILDDNGQSSWADKYSVEFIEKEREGYSQMGTIDVWYRERMCVAISPDSQKFKPEMLNKRFNPKSIKRKDLSIYITVDLAVSQRLTADYTAIVVVGVDSENNWFVLDIIYGRFDPSQTMDEIFKAVSKYKPIKVGIEQVAFQKAIEHFLVKEMPKRNIFFSITPLKAQKNKELRIETLQPRFTAGTIWLPEQNEEERVPWLIELESELLSFPNGKHDDLIDSLAYVEQIAIPPSGSWGKYSSTEIPYFGSL
jgi:predicted phage terminase large subunit-like protein